MRLIDADAFKSKLKKQDARTFAIEEINLLIDFAPIIDAVPVVRCANCKCWTEWSNGTGSCSRFALDWIGTDADDFCSMGERKDND